MRFLFYSHDALGLGHVRRNLAIASALVDLAPQARVLLTTSVEEVCHLGLPPGVDTLKLPGLRKVGPNQYASRRLGLGPREIRRLRSGVLEAAVESFAPTVVLVDKHAFGAGGELRGALEKARSGGARLVLGLRDILDTPTAVLQEWSAERVRERAAEYYDQVVIYGQRTIYDPISQYQFPPALAQRTRFCGYVVDAPRQTRPARQNGEPGAAAGRPAVLGTAGGGEDGLILLRAFVRAAGEASWNSLAVTGPQLNQPDFAGLEQLAADRQVSLRAFVPRLWDRLSATDCLVCMGGYNTLIEAIANGVRVVCVPRVSPRSEQLLRAQAFERLGLLRLLHPNELTPERLREAVDLALAKPREPMLECARVLQCDGADRAARYLLDLAREAGPGLVRRPAFADQASGVQLIRT